MKIPTLVTADWLFEHKNHKNLVILDTSPKSNVSNLTPVYTDLQIEGARLFDMTVVFYDKKSQIPNMFPSVEVFTKECQKLGINKDSYIVVYDNLGIYTSPRAWWMFKTMGHENVGVLDGGLSTWKDLRFPCEPKQSRNFKKGNFIAIYNPKMVENAQSILDKLTSNKKLIIDARSKGRFNGTLPEPRKNMQSGHIPNAVNLPFKEVLSNGKMKPKEELKQLFKNFDTEGKDLIFTCGSGITACVILLAAELTLNNVKALYDGSWAEWGLGTKYPVA